MSAPGRLPTFKHQAEYGGKEPQNHECSGVEERLFCSFRYIDETVAMAEPRKSGGLPGRRGWNFPAKLESFA